MWPSSMIEWFDDLKVGMRFKSEAVTVSKEDIIRFASRIRSAAVSPRRGGGEEDDPRRAAASGWHTAAIAMRLAASTRPFGPHPLFGAGVDDLRWLKPVRPGDTIHLEGEVVELVPSRLEAARRRPHQMDRLQPAWRGGLHLQSDRDRAEPAEVSAEACCSALGLEGYSKGWVAVLLDGDIHEIRFCRDIAECARPPASTVPRSTFPSAWLMTANGSATCLARERLRPHSSRVFTGARRWLLAGILRSRPCQSRCRCSAARSGVSRQL